MNSKLSATLLALTLSMASAAGMACDETRVDADAQGSLLGEALEELRAERGRQMQANARAALAQLRSETETALAHGASTSAGPSVKTSP